MTIVIPSREPGCQMRGRYPVRSEKRRLMWGIYLAWDKKQVQCDPGQLAARFSRQRSGRTVQHLVT